MVHGGTLTLENAAGGGTLVIGEGATVNGGIHCMETSGETVNTITITGGSFAGILKINAQSTCTISGGTFTVDVTEWLAEGYNVKNNGDGTYTVVETMVAKLILSNGTEKFFATLSDALAAAKQEWVDNGNPVTVVLLENYEEASILCVPVGTTLDLNGHTITVGTAVIAYGPIIDTKTDVINGVAGGIVVEKADAIVHLQTNNEIMVEGKAQRYMPLYDANAKTYKFFKYTISTAINKGDIANGKAQFAVAVKFNTLEAYDLLASGASKASVKITFTWANNTLPLVFTFSQTSLGQMRDTAEKNLANGEVGNPSVWMTLNGISETVAETLTATFEFSSELGVERSIPKSVS